MLLSCCQAAVWDSSVRVAQAPSQSSGKSSFTCQLRIELRVFFFEAFLSIDHDMSLPITVPEASAKIH